MLVSELLEVLTKVQQYGDDAEVVLKRLESEGEKTFIHDIELVLTGKTVPNVVTVTHSVQPPTPVDTPPAIDPAPAATVDPTTAASTAA